MSRLGPEFPMDFPGGEMTGDPCPVPKNCDIFTLQEQIGTGSFANIYKAIHRATGQCIAIKTYRMKRGHPDYYSRAAVEMAFIRFLDHPNIIDFVFAKITRQYMYLSVEYSPYGSLANFLESRTGLSESTVQSVIKQIVSALHYIHSMSICHGDIKPDNIIVVDIKEPLMGVKLCDFGISDIIIKTPMHQKRTGSFFYMAPEMHLGFPYDHTCDLFSVGVLMYEMLYGSKPLPTHVTKQQYFALLKKRQEIIFLDHQFPDVDTVFLTSSCISLVKNLLSYDKQIRLSGESLLNHPFLKITPIVDNHCHYSKACECLIKGVEKVDQKQYGPAYIDISEAILHLKIHINKIDHDAGLLLYMRKKAWEYQKYLDQVEGKLLSGNDQSKMIIQTHSERLRCLLRSTPALVNGFDICTIGQMYSEQQREGPHACTLIKQGLDILFPLLAIEPDGIRKQMLATKIDEWMKIVESFKESQREKALAVMRDN